MVARATSLIGLVALVVGASAQSVTLASSKGLLSLPRGDNGLVSASSAVRAVMGLPAKASAGVADPLRLPRFLVVAALRDIGYQVPAELDSTAEAAIPATAFDLLGDAHDALVGEISQDADVLCASQTASCPLQAEGPVPAEGPTAASIAAAASGLAASNLLEAAQRNEGLWSVLTAEGAAVEVDGTAIVVSRGGERLVLETEREATARTLSALSVIAAVPRAAVARDASAPRVLLVDVDASDLGDSPLARVVVQAGLHAAMRAAEASFPGRVAAVLLEGAAAPSASATARRVLSSAGPKDKVAAAKRMPNGEYQIFLWTGLVLAFTVFLGMYFTLFMDMGPDTAGLWAQFKQTHDPSRT